jgi:hypothetical protein
MPFTGTVTGHDNWPISGRFWPVAWVNVVVLRLRF